MAPPYLLWMHLPDIHFSEGRENEMVNYLGVDIGTTGVKSIVVNTQGKVLQVDSVPLTMEVPKPAWAQQNPEDWVKAVDELFRRVAKSHKVSAICFSGQMHSLVALDDQDRIIRPAILWCDQRTTKQCIQATEVLGGEKAVIGLIGNPILEGFTLPKLLWMRDEEPELFAKIAKVMLPKDYLVYHLTGSFGMDRSDASGTACFDVMQLEWSEKVLNTLGIPSSIFPPHMASTAIRGELNPKLAKSLGWDRVQVVSGGADNACAALGIGLGHAGDGMVSLGTSGTVLALTDRTNPDESGKIHYFRHVVGDLAYYMGVMLSAAQSLNWVRQQCFPEQPWRSIEAMMSESPVGSRGILFLPYLQGERTPHRDPHARGVFFGISTMHDRRDLLRAVVEGISFGLRESFELIQKLTPMSNIRVVGGGAKNKVWRQILADNFQMPVQVPEMDEGGAFGAAMLAALGNGIPLDQVMDWISISETVEPDPNHIPLYTERFSQFQGLYQDLKDRFRS